MKYSVMGETENILNNPYRVVSLFSGCGGLDLGFTQHGFEIVWANDFFKSANQKQELPMVAMFVNGSGQMSNL
jgi:hypothetical protein